MSRLFTDALILPFLGATNNVPVQQCRPKAREPTVIGINIDWNSFWPANHPANLGISVDLKGLSTETAKLDRVISVKIDNTGSTVPIYLLAVDTGDIVTCPPQTVVIMPIMTNGLVFTIYARGLTAGFIPLTQVFFANYQMITNVDPEVQIVFPQFLGSPLIQRSNTLTPGFAPPALGDQTVNYLSTVGGVGVFQNNIFGTPFVSGFIYLTHIDANMIASNPANAFIVWRLETAGPPAQTLFIFQSQASPNHILTLNNMNLRLDATQTWRLNATSFVGVSINLTHIFCWTFNNN